MSGRIHFQIGGKLFMQFGLTKEQIKLLDENSDRLNFYDLDNKTKAELLTLNMYPRMIADINDYLCGCYYSSHTITGEKIAAN